MDAFGNGAIDIQGGDLTPPVTPVCFLSGTFIETPKGPVRVDELCDGDLLETADRGGQPLVWVTFSDHEWPNAEDRHKPIEFKAGSLGRGLPREDLRVSPQHHMLIEGPQCERMFGHTQVLAPAKGLTNLSGVRVMEGKKSARYFHLLLSEHALLQAAGSWSESFYPGPMSMKMLSRAQKNQLFALIPGVNVDVVAAYGETARPRITRRQTEALVEQMLRDGALADDTLVG